MRDDFKLATRNARVCSVTTSVGGEIDGAAASSRLRSRGSRLEFSVSGGALRGAVQVDARRGSIRIHARGLEFDRRVGAAVALHLRVGSATKDAALDGLHGESTAVGDRWFAGVVGR